MNLIKLIVKHLLAIIIYYGGLARLVERKYRKGHALILMYHRVVPETDGSKLREPEDVESQRGIVVSERFFRRQLRFLSRRYRIIPLQDVADHINHDTRGRGLAVVITFDDGWRDNYEIAAPLLAKYRAPVTIFITTDFAQQTRVPWPELLTKLLRVAESSGKAGTVTQELQELVDLPGLRFDNKAVKFDADFIDSLIEGVKALDPASRGNLLRRLAERIGASVDAVFDGRMMMNWEEIKSLSEQGVSLGGHGKSHELLDTLSAVELDEELRSTYATLAEELASGDFPFAYPNGNFNQQVKKHVRAAGFSCAVTTQRGVVGRSSDMFELPRINITSGCCRGMFGGFSQALFACHLLGIFSQN